MNTSRTHHASGRRASSQSSTEEAREALQISRDSLLEGYYWQKLDLVAGYVVPEGAVCVDPEALVKTYIARLHTNRGSIIAKLVGDGRNKYEFAEYEDGDYVCKSRELLISKNEKDAFWLPVPDKRLPQERNCIYAKDQNGSDIVIGRAWHSTGPNIGHWIPGQIMVDAQCIFYSWAGEGYLSEAYDVLYTGDMQKLWPSRSGSLSSSRSEQKHKWKCIVCFDKKGQQTVFPACGHIAACRSCAILLEHCPICRRVSTPITVYYS